MAAAKVGGILANDTPAGGFHLRQSGDRDQSDPRRSSGAGVQKLLFLGSSCIYPKFAPQPIDGGCAADRPAGADQRVVRHRQDRRHQAVPGLSPAAWLRLHLGHADQSLRAGRQFRPDLQPCGAGADAQDRRGQGERRRLASRSGASGTPQREFLYVDDLADACVFLLKHYNAPSNFSIWAPPPFPPPRPARHHRQGPGRMGPFSFKPKQPRTPPGLPLGLSRAPPPGGGGRAPPGGGPSSRSTPVSAPPAGGRLRVTSPHLG